MIYISYLTFSFFYLYGLKKYSNEKSSIKIITILFPIIILWVIIIGGQYGVGTDYFSYIDIFNGNKLNLYEYQQEYLFVYFVEFCNSIGLYGQSLFFIISLFSIIVLLKIGLKITSPQYLYLFFFLFVCYSTVFNNQMNTIRQYIVVYLFSYLILLINQRHYILGSLLLAISIFIHHSSFILIFFVFVLLWGRNISSKKILYFIVLGGFLGGIITRPEFIEYIARTFDFYSYFFDNGSLNETSLMGRIVKYTFLPLYLLAISKLNDFQLSDNEKKLFSIGVISYSLKIAFLTLGTVQRIGWYFEILMCIPLLYLLIYLKNRTSKMFIPILLFILIIYAIKVILFAEREYSYDSYFLKFI